MARKIQNEIREVVGSERKPRFSDKEHTSRDITKPTKWLCAQRRLRSAWTSTQSDQSLRYALNGQLRTQMFLHADSEDSDQADLSFRWAHTQFVGFVMLRLICRTPWQRCIRYCDILQQLVRWLFHTDHRKIKISKPYFIEKNTTILANHGFIHHDPTFWVEP